MANALQLAVFGEYNFVTVDTVFDKTYGFAEAVKKRTPRSCFVPRCY